MSQHHIVPIKVSSESVLRDTTRCYGDSQAFDVPFEAPW